MTIDRYVIMANGKGRRWGNYGGVPKHLIEVEGETLLARTVRLIRGVAPMADIVISSSDRRCAVPGIRRFEPALHECEIDRFAQELICDNVCFLYGDTYYTEESVWVISSAEVTNMLFFGSCKTIFAVRSRFAETMRGNVVALRSLFLNGGINVCKGWQLYQRYAGLPLGEPCIGDDYVLIEDGTRDFNSPEDLNEFVVKDRRGC